MGTDFTCRSYYTTHKTVATMAPKKMTFQVLCQYHIISCRSFKLKPNSIDATCTCRCDKKQPPPELYGCIPVNIWELLGGRSPPSPTNSSKGEILHVAFKLKKLYLVVE